MADHVWTVVCSKTLIDPSSNVASLIDITERLILGAVSEEETVEQGFERAKSEGKKGIRFPVQLQLVSWWVRSDYSKPETAKIRVAIMGPEGDRLFQQDAVIEMEEGTTGRRLTVNFNAVPITSLGRFWFLVEQPKSGKGTAKRWTTAARIPVEITAGA